MYEIIILPYFFRRLKKYAKKYQDLKSELVQVLRGFDKGSHTSLGKNLYKLRLHSKGLAKGKRGSFRLIIMLIEVQKYIIPITVYFKGDTENITKKELMHDLSIVLDQLKNREM